MSHRPIVFTVSEAIHPVLIDKIRELLEKHYRRRVLIIIDELSGGEPL